MKENQNAQLVRMKNGSRTPVALSPRPQNAPFSSRTPRLDQTTSGTGVPLTEIIQAEALEKHIKGLERLLREADMEMEEAVGRMNHAQVDVAQLQSDRYVFTLGGRQQNLRKSIDRVSDRIELTFSLQRRGPSSDSPLASGHSDRTRFIQGSGWLRIVVALSRFPPRPFFGLSFVYIPPTSASAS